VVDRVYRSDLPRLRKTLLNIRKDFSQIDPSTDWVRLRVDPLLAHVDQLGAMLRAWDSSRQSGVVPMLHSDLVYFRQNVKGLKRVLASETKRFRKQRSSNRPGA
jgi:hypothetical protein